MRDYRKLEVFRLADELALRVYAVTRQFPGHETYGLVSQLRRAAVSIAANIVEGAARQTRIDFVRLLTIAYGSACELEYELSLAHRLGYISRAEFSVLGQSALRTCRALASLIRSIRRDDVDRSSGQ